MKCDVCDGEFPEENALIGMAFSIKGNPDEFIAQALREQLSPYLINKQYLVCYPCWFKSLGIKP